jgi:hypothetical protein
MPKEPKKKLLVKTDEIITEPIKEPVPLAVVDTVPIQAEKVDKRGKHPNVISNLEKGREKLKAVWEEKRIAKAELVEKAVMKKVALKEKQKNQIMQDYGVETLSTDEEEEEQIIKPIKKVVKAVKAVIPKKKPIRYVEESDSDEEEVIYVKKSKPVSVAPKGPQLIFY